MESPGISRKLAEDTQVVTALAGGAEITVLEAIAAQLM